MLEVEEPPKSSDLVSLTREELGLILEAQSIGQSQTSDFVYWWFG